MKPVEMVMVVMSDIAGQVRGKGFPARDIERRRDMGVAWTPTNIMIGNRNAIAPSPWGPFGDLTLRPDWSSRVRIDFDDDQGIEHFVLADAMELDGRPWACCPRDFLKRGLARLEEAGFRLKAAFEHEFAYHGVEERPNSAYNLESFRRQGVFGGLFLAALEEAGLGLDTFMPEYGPMQYEVTVAPRPALRAADEAVILRQLARSVAERLGDRVSFAPLLRPDAVGNGVHLHFSLTDLQGRPASHDPDGPHGMSRAAGAFVEGVRRHMPALSALSAASVVSYLRLVPHRWSAAFNNLGLQDREAGIRICPVFGQDEGARRNGFHFEYRAADAAASPYLFLGGLVAAGVAGIGEGLTPAEPTTSDPAGMSDDELARHDARWLPRSLGEALDLLERDPVLGDAMGRGLTDAYLAHKRFEVEQMAALDDDDARCAAYAEVY